MGMKKSQYGFWLMFLMMILAQGMKNPWTAAGEMFCALICGIAGLIHAIKFKD